MKKLLLISTAVIIGGCAYIDPVIDQGVATGAKALANAVDADCQLSVAKRQENYNVYMKEQEAVNMKTGRETKMLPFDCDGDDKSDF